MAIFTVTQVEDEAPVRLEDPQGLSLSPPQELTLREALALAAETDEPDVIRFDPETFAGGAIIALDHVELRIDHDVTIDGDADGDGVADVTIDAEGDSRAFVVVDQAIATLRNLVIINGDAARRGDVAFADERGGAIAANAETRLVLDNVVVRDSRSVAEGGAIANFGELTVRDSFILRNDAAAGGGAIYNEGSVRLIDTNLEQNTTNGFGGAIYNRGAVFMDGVAVTQNTAGDSENTGRGGGVANLGALTAVRTRFEGNNAGLEGGAIDNDGVAQFASVSFVVNSAADGAAIASSGRLLELQNAFVLLNEAGAAVSATGPTWIASSTVVGNGGAGLAAGAARITNSIFVDNAGGDVAVTALVADGVNIVGVGADADPTDGVIQTPSTAALFEGAVDAQLTTSITDTAFGVLPFGLASDGVAVDAGVAADTPRDVLDLDQDDDTLETIPSDAFGRPRVLGQTIDIGAQELDPPTPPIANPFGAVDVFRFFNVNRSTHIFTADPIERDALLASDSSFRFENTGFEALPADAADLDGPGGAVAVFRLINMETNGELLTASAAERAFVVQNRPEFEDQGVAFAAYQNGDDADGLEPVWRFYNTVSQAHFYTMSVAERNAILANQPEMQFENIAFYAFEDDFNGPSSATVLDGGGDALI